MTKDEAFSLALEIEQSELNIVYRDLVIMGRAAVKLMERNIDGSLSIAKHHQEFVTGMKRFEPAAYVLKQAEDWLDQQYKVHAPAR